MKIYGTHDDRTVQQLERCVRAVIHEADLERIGRAMVLANTPRSLLRWLEKDPTVLRLSNVAAEPELLDALESWLDQQARSEIAVGACYAYLVAIAHRRRQRGDPFSTPPIELARLRWADAIWTALKNTTVTSNYVSLELSAKNRTTVFGDSGGSRRIRRPDDHR